MYRLKTTANFNVASGTENHAELENLDYEHSGHTGFQPTLVSGTNIKTINNQSILGEGNINIEGGGGGGSTDVQINSSSITSSGIANILTEGVYNPSTNKIATMSEIPAKLSELTNDSGFIDKNVNNLTNYELKTNTGASIVLSINSTTYVMTMTLKNSAGTALSTQTVDLPLETMVIGGSYDNTTKKIILTLKSGSTIDIPVGDLVSGLQSEITSNNKLSSDLVDDSNKTNKFVTTSEKSTWNGKYSKPSGGIPKNDLASDVKTSLGKADTALQSYTEQYTGTITGITMNGVSKGTSGVVDLGTVITEHQSLSNYQTLLSSSNKVSSDYINDATATNKFVTSAEKTKLDSLPNIVILTQTEYDAIITKSETTIYMIVED